MKAILEQWSGKYELDGDICVDLYDFNPKDGDEFHIKLLSKRREVRGSYAEREDLLQAR